MNKKNKLKDQEIDEMDRGFDYEEDEYDNLIDLDDVDDMDEFDFEEE